MILDQAIVSTPFPGLRPFERLDTDFFFGRRQPSQELTQRLQEVMFTAVLGYSGSGKSSLVRCGVIPQLLSDNLRDWEIIETRPGSSPMENLVSAISESSSLCDLDQAPEEWIRSTLYRSKNGLVDLVKQSGRSENQPVLVVVDQFEEIFRFRRYQEQKRSAESIQFVNLLTQASKQSSVPLYVLLTMRSEFLGDCAVFHGLVPAINRGQYLIPSMTRAELREVITGPIDVYNRGQEKQVRVSQGLVETVLNDMIQDPDQLPVFQHAMFRTWQIWSQGDRDQMINRSHYERAGAMESALDRHVGQVFDELPSIEDQTRCEQLFRAITETDTEGNETRRPLTVSKLTDVLQVNSRQIIKIVDAFGEAGSFLMKLPYKSDHQDRPEELIDICHESLIRKWKKLSEWTKQERQDADYYRLLCLRVKARQGGTGELLIGKDLEEAERWFLNRKPNKAWAQRYDRINQLQTGFDEVEKLLLQSVSNRHKQKRKEARIKLSFISLGAVALMLLIGFLAERALSAKELQAKNEELKCLNQDLEVERDIKTLQRDSILIQQTQLDESYKKLTLSAEKIKEQNCLLADANFIIKEKNSDLKRKNKRIWAQLDRIKRDSAKIALQKSAIAKLYIGLQAAYFDLDSLNRYLQANNNALAAIDRLYVGELELADSLAKVAYDSLVPSQPDQPFYRALEKVWSEKLKHSTISREFSNGNEGIRCFDIRSNKLVAANTRGVVFQTVITQKKAGFLFDSLQQARLPDGNDQVLKIKILKGHQGTWVITKKGKLYGLVQGNAKRAFSLRLEEITPKAWEGKTHVFDLDSNRRVIFSIGDSIYRQAIGEATKPELIASYSSEVLSFWDLPNASFALTRSGLIYQTGEGDSVTSKVLTFTQKPTVIRQLNKEHVVIGDAEGTLWRYNTHTGEYLELARRASAISGLAIHRTDSTVNLALSSFDNTTSILSIDPLFLGVQEQKTRKLHQSSWVYDVKYWPEGSFLITSGENATVKFWPMTLKQSREALNELSQQSP